jgi:hypothetical protein
MAYYNIDETNFNIYNDAKLGLIIHKYNDILNYLLEFLKKRDIYNLSLLNKRTRYSILINIDIFSIYNETSIIKYLHPKIIMRNKYYNNYTDKIYKIVDTHPFQYCKDLIFIRNQTHKTNLIKNIMKLSNSKAIIKNLLLFLYFHKQDEIKQADSHKNYLIDLVILIVKMDFKGLVKIYFDIFTSLFLDKNNRNNKDNIEIINYYINESYEENKGTLEFRSSEVLNNIFTINVLLGIRDNNIIEEISLLNNGLDHNQLFNNNLYFDNDQIINNSTIILRDHINPTYNLDSYLKLCNPICIYIDDITIKNILKYKVKNKPNFLPKIFIKYLGNTKDLLNCISDNIDCSCACISIMNIFALSDTMPKSDTATIPIQNSGDIIYEHIFRLNILFLTDTTEDMLKIKFGHIYEPVFKMFDVEMIKYCFVDDFVLHIVKKIITKSRRFSALNGGDLDKNIIESLLNISNLSIKMKYIKTIIDYHNLENLVCCITGNNEMYKLILDTLVFYSKFKFDKILTSQTTWNNYIIPHFLNTTEINNMSHDNITSLFNMNIEFSKCLSIESIKTLINKASYMEISSIIIIDMYNLDKDLFRELIIKYKSTRSVILPAIEDFLCKNKGLIFQFVKNLIHESNSKVSSFKINKNIKNMINNMDYESISKIINECMLDNSFNIAIKNYCEQCLTNKRKMEISKENESKKRIKL